jgi:aminomethyltransferase
VIQPLIEKYSRNIRRKITKVHCGSAARITAMSARCVVRETGAALRALEQWQRPARCMSTHARTSILVSRAVGLRSAGIPLPQQSKAQEFRSRKCDKASYATSAAEAPTETPRRTPLYDFHLAHGAKMIAFGGYSMPVLYSDQSLTDSHLFTRLHASLFDVSHMVQRLFSGEGAAAFLQRITPSDVGGLGQGRSTLSALMHETGGIVDDCVIVRLPDGVVDSVFGTEGVDGRHEGPVYYMVTNAACREKDDAYLQLQMEKWQGQGGAKTHHHKIENRGLVALQGPEAAAVLGELTADPSFGSLDTLFFGQSGSARISTGEGRSSQPVLISRGGYTGEDGFEISVAAEDTVAVTEALLGSKTSGEARVRLSGLGARDSLRLEAGMCLYGHDLDDTTTPAEAGLGWIVAKNRRQEEPTTSFLGAQTVVPQLTPRSKGGAGVQRYRIGMVVEGAPAREGADVIDSDTGEAVGRVTSGCPSPTLGKNIAMGYVKDGFRKAGMELAVSVRGRRRRAVVTKMPFVATRYMKGP